MSCYFALNGTGYLTGTLLHVYSITTCRYVGDEYGLMSVIKFDAEDEKLLQLPYHISANSIRGISF